MGFPLRYCIAYKPNLAGYAQNELNTNSVLTHTARPLAFLFHPIYFVTATQGTYYPYYTYSTPPYYVAGMDIAITLSQCAWVCKLAQ